MACYARCQLGSLGLASFMARVRAGAEVFSFPSACFRASIVSMAKQTVLAKKRRGPAPTGKGLQVVVRLQPDQLAALDAWIAIQDASLTRPEAMRAMLAMVTKLLRGSTLPRKTERHPQNEKTGKRE